MTKAQQLYDEALELMDALRDKFDAVATQVKNSDYGDSGVDLLEALDLLEGKLKEVHLLAEDTYATVEDLELAP